MKNQTLLLFVICLSFLDSFWCNTSTQAELNRTRDDGLGNEIHVGVILDIGSWQGKVIQSCISMAISDFYSLQKSHKARVILHWRNSQGDPFRALSAGKLFFFFFTLKHRLPCNWVQLNLRCFVNVYIY